MTEAYNEAGWQGSVTAGVEGGRFAVDLVSALTAVSGGAKIVAKLPSAAKTLVNAIAEAPVAGGRASQIGAIGNISGAKATGTAAHSSANDLKLSTQLAYEDAGILTRGGAGLTKEAVAASREIPISGGRLTNPAVVKELTANGSKIEDWGKFTTQSITLPSGQRSQIHYYMNKVTGELNLNIDFKVKGGVQ